MTYFETEYFYVMPDAGALRIPLPLSAELQGVMHAGAENEQLIATLRSDWTPSGQSRIAQGSLIAFPMKAFLATRELPQVAVLYTPDGRSAI